MDKLTQDKLVNIAKKASVLMQNKDWHKLHNDEIILVSALVDGGVIKYENKNGYVGPAIDFLESDNDLALELSTSLKEQ